MRIRTFLLAAVAAAALIAAPTFAESLRGKIVAVDENSITVLSNGQTVTYIIPAGVQVQAPSQQTSAVPQLRAGQTVTLTIDEPVQVQGKTPTASSIRLEGDTEIEEDVEIDRDVEVDAEDDD